MQFSDMEILTLIPLLRARVELDTQVLALNPHFETCESCRQVFTDRADATRALFHKLSEAMPC